MAYAADHGVSPYEPSACALALYAEASPDTRAFIPPPLHTVPMRGAWPKGRTALKPGGIPLRPMSVSEIVESAITAMRRNPLTTFGLTAVVMVLCSAAAVALDDLVVNTLTAGRGVIFAPGVGFLTRLLLLALTTPFLLFLGDAFLTGMLTAVVSQGVLGRRLSMAEAWRMARPRMLAVVGTTVLAALATVAGLIGTIAVFSLVARTHVLPPVLLVLLGLLAGGAVVTFLTARFAAAAPAVGLERKGPGESLGRSWCLVRSGTRRVMGFVLLTYLMAGTAMLSVEIPFDVISHATDPNLLGGLFAPHSGSALGTDMAALGGIIAGTLTWPFLATARVLLYLDLRMRREGLHLALQSAVNPPTRSRW
jgi:hypothetical protein